MFRRSGEAVALWGLALILAATLYPFDFAFDERERINDLFSLGADLTARGKDLLIGADAAFAQPFRGKIGQLRIYREALTPAEVTIEEQSRPPVTATQGLAASFSFTEGGGAVLKDDSGNGNHGNLVGPPLWISQEGRETLAFDGMGHYVQVPNSPSIDIEGRSITIAMSVVLEDSPSDGVILSKPWWQGVMAPPYHQYAVEFGKRERSVDFYFADTRLRQRGPFSVYPPIGVWTHIVFVYDGTVRGYVDGRELLAASPRQLDVVDILGNLLLFVPLGFGLAVVAHRRQAMPRRTITVIVMIGAALSLGVETLQCWLPGRDPSWLDVLTNSTSSALGAGVYFAETSEVVQRMKRLLAEYSGPPRKL